MPGKPGSLTREQGFREIKVHIWPGRLGARYSVHARHRRGGDLIWDRRLCTSEVDEAHADACSTLAGVLRATAASLLRAAQRLDELS